MKRAAVIGAGLGGISAAVYLRSFGWEVDVYEKQSFPGGKAGELYAKGYRFDTGPSLLNMLWVFDDVFDKAGTKLENEITVIPLEEICSYFLSDGSYLKAWSDLERFKKDLDTLSKGSGEDFERYLNISKRIHELGGELFLTVPIHEIRRLLKPSIIWKLMRFLGIHPFSTLDQLNRRYFKDERLVQLFDRYATYNGSNPFKTPATMAVIPYVEYSGGGYTVEEGIHAIPAKLSQAAAQGGVQFHFSKTVDQIILKGKRVKGIEVEGESIDYDAVFSNSDVISTYERLLKLPNAPEVKRYRKLEPSSSGIVFYWGIKKHFPQLTVNNIFFSEDYRAEFNSMFKDNDVAKHPTVYVNISSKEAPADAPEYGENWFVLVNAPADKGQNWDALVGQVRKSVLDVLSLRLGESIEDLIEFEDILTPPMIEERTDSSFGSLYGISSNTLQAAFLRHRNRSKRFPGLYFCGGSAHPGGGMPLVILSGKMTAELAEEHSNEQ
jgi:phytoene desaturase